jgi:hypothetical protein
VTRRRRRGTSLTEQWRRKDLQVLEPIRTCFIA